MTDLPTQNAETYLGDGLYASFDGWQVILRAPRPHPTDNGATDYSHFVGLEPETYQSLLAWLGRYPRLKKHLEGR